MLLIFELLIRPYVFIYALLLRNNKCMVAIFIWIYYDISAGI